MKKILYISHDAWLIESCLLGGEEDTTDMSHVDGSDDGVGYGVFGESNSGWPRCERP